MCMPNVLSHLVLLKCSDTSMAVGQIIRLVIVQPGQLSKTRLLGRLSHDILLLESSLWEN